MLQPISHYAYAHSHVPLLKDSSVQAECLFSIEKTLQAYASISLGISHTRFRGYLTSENSVGANELCTLMMTVKVCSSIMRNHALDTC